VLGSGLNRGDSGISKESSSETKENLGTDNTTDLTSVVTTSESNQETESESVGEGTKDDESFESSDFHDYETESHTGQSGGEGEEGSDSCSGKGGLAERDDKTGVEEGTLNGPGCKSALALWMIGMR